MICFGCANKPYVYPSQYQRRYTDLAWLETREDGQLMLHANGKVTEYEGLDSLLPEFSSVPQAETFVRLAKKEAAQAMPETESWYVLSAELAGMARVVFLGVHSESGRDRDRYLFLTTGGLSSGMILLGGPLFDESRRHQIRANTLLSDAFVAFNEQKVAELEEEARAKALQRANDSSASPTSEEDDERSSPESP